MVEDDDRETIYRDYTATMQRNLVTLLGHYFVGNEWQDMPSYLELAHGGYSAPKDEVAEAKQHINEMFGIDIDKALKERG